MADVVPGYSVVKRLGMGARSQVFLVVRSETGAYFTLKKVVREDHEDDRFLVQAINEYDIARSFEHASLRRMHEIHRIRKMLRLKEVQVVMEYVDGVSLDAKRPEGIDQISEIFLQVAEGLQAMHEHGFLHTDIKPNNILLTAKAEVKIIDFGQSCPMGTRKPRIQGTPDYIAPEQVERHPLNQQTDVFNFGATLYWALIGKAYPTVITKHGGPQDHSHEPRVSAPSPHEVRPEVPAGLSRLVMECCAYERGQRPRNMKEVISRLQLALTGLRRVAAGFPEESPTDEAAVAEAARQQALDDSDEALDFSALREAVRESRSKRKEQDGGGE